MKICCTGSAAKRQQEAEAREDELIASYSQRIAAKQRNADRYDSQQAAGSTIPSQPIKSVPTQGHKPAITPLPLTVQTEEDLCRVCWGPENTADRLVCPCKCKGSIRLVHVECLRMWLETSGRVKCEVMLIQLLDSSPEKSARAALHLLNHALPKCGRRTVRLRCIFASSLLFISQRALPACYFPSAKITKVKPLTVWTCKIVVCHPLQYIK